MCTHLSKYAIIIVNVLFFVVGLVVAGLSTAGIVKLKMEGVAVDEITVFLTIGCVIGCIVVVSSCLGCWGAATESKAILVLYIISLAVMIGLAGFGTYKGFTATGAELFAGVKSHLNIAFSDQESFHKIENTFGCCGVDGVTNYTSTGRPVPTECCSVETRQCTGEKKDILVCTCPAKKALLGCGMMMTIYMLYFARPATYAMLALCIVEILMLIGAVVVMVTYEKRGKQVFSQRA